MEPISRRNALAALSAALILPSDALAEAAKWVRPNAMQDLIHRSRTPRTDLGIAQLSEHDLRWLRDAKFGMFIHWGLYAGPAKGEWWMERDAVPPEEYRKLAFDKSSPEYFAADRFEPEHWAEVAKAAGMRWMCLTARHHDGYSLFDNPHPNAFTSIQSHGTDFVAKYVAACRKAGLKVGLYFSPIDWRYPGYYDVTGSDCAPNRFGYKTDPAHHENARLWKEENYVAVRKLLTGYGHIDHIFWDGGWLAQRGSDADGAFFHEPGKYLAPDNPWQISEQYLDREPHTGRALGIMGMTRKNQPHAIVNSRYGWIGDMTDEEGGDPPAGPIRSDRLANKTISIHGNWGYDAGALERGDVVSSERIIEYLANSVVRDMTFLLNFGPDRHGSMPAIVESRLREVGAWLSRAGDSVYGTQGGPWNPVDGQYGFSWKGDRLFVHLFRGFQGTEFSVPAIAGNRVLRAKELITGRELAIDTHRSPTLITGIDRSHSPVDTVVEVRYTSTIES